MAKKNIPPLIVEHKNCHSNLIYLSLLEYKRQNYLVIMDNIKGNEISAYVLDFAEAEKIDVDWFLSIATRWYYASSEKYPLSFEFNKLNLTEKVSPILKTFKIDYVSRLMGEVFQYEIDVKPKVKRKKVNKIPSTVEVKLRKVTSIDSIPR